MRSLDTWKAEAIKDCPEGEYCAWCGKENDFFDDIGFFWIAPFPQNAKELQGATCESCYRGELGKAHGDWYGVGDR